MVKCDLCDAVCKPIDLTELLPSYRIDGVTDVCPACAKWATKRKFDLMAENAPKLRAEIAAKRGLPPAPPIGWLSMKLALRRALGA